MVLALVLGSDLTFAGGNATLGPVVPCQGLASYSPYQRCQTYQTPSPVVSGNYYKCSILCNSKEVFSVSLAFLSAETSYI